MKARISISDVFILMGLVLIGTGLFFWFGIGPAIAVDGALMLLIGVVWNITEGRMG